MQLYKGSFSSMGCPCSYQFYCESADLAKEAENKLISRVQYLDSYYSNYSTTSFVADINRQSGKAKGIKVDPETAQILNYAQACFHQSDGLFDITSGILRHAWNYQQEKPKIPSQKMIDNLLKKVGWDKLVWESPRLILPISGMNLDFGGVVKEYAADAAGTTLKQLGIHHGLVDLGGDISVIGPHLDGRPWAIGIRNPSNPDTEIAIIHVYQGGLASSGDYERYFEIDGIRYGHILSPKTGWPVRGVSAASILGEHCLVAGSLATISMLMEGEDIFKETPVHYLLLDTQACVIGNRGFHVNDSVIRTHKNSSTILEPPKLFTNPPG